MESGQHAPNEDGSFTIPGGANGPLGGTGLYETNAGNGQAATPTPTTPTTPSTPGGTGAGGQPPTQPGAGATPPGGGGQQQQTPGDGGTALS